MPEVSTGSVAEYLRHHHYLGPARRGWAWSDDRGVIVLGPPTSRSLPVEWLELSRWCLAPGRPNSGSEQWAEIQRHIIETRPGCTTVVSYSDPSAGHSGALYRACGWVWAPTWHRLRPPPTGGGSWDGGKTYETPKDRWVCPLRPDARRPSALRVRDESLEKRYPWMVWREPPLKRGLCVRNAGGFDRRRWLADHPESPVVARAHAQPPPQTLLWADLR